MKWSHEQPRFIGVLHLPPLPGTPFWDSATWPTCLDRVRRDAQLLADEGMSGVLLQSFDRVYEPSGETDPARVAAMTLYANALAHLRSPGFVIGVQLLRNQVAASLAIAKLTSLDFIRAGTLIGATLTTHGWVEPNSLDVMRRRRLLEAESISIAADIHSSHFRWAGPPVANSDLAKKTQLVGGDAIVIEYADRHDLAAAVDDIRRAAPDLPILQGGHVSAETLAARSAGTAGGFVRSSLLGPDGKLDRHRVARFAAAARELRHA